MESTSIGRLQSSAIGGLGNSAATASVAKHTARLNLSELMRELVFIPAAL